MNMHNLLLTVVSLSQMCNTFILNTTERVKIDIKICYDDKLVG